MTREQWALEPNKVVFIDTSDKKEQAFMRWNEPERGARYVDTGWTCGCPLQVWGRP